VRVPDATLVSIISGSFFYAFHAINISCSWGFGTTSVAVLDAARPSLVDPDFSNGVELRGAMAAKLNSPTIVLAL
jgi:hypothetical protein